MLGPETQNRNRDPGCQCVNISDILVCVSEPDPGLTRRNSSVWSLTPNLGGFPNITVRSSRLLAAALLALKHSGFVTAPPYLSFPAGKSTIAQQLANRLNMPNVMQTDITCEVREASQGVEGC